MSDRLIARAPAKINLTLHVVGRRADGWHELESLVAFTRAGDTLAFMPGGPLSLSLAGPRATATGATAENLVLKAAQNLAARIDGLRLGSFELTKRLPVAAGIGGGSSDAAAALRLIARANAIALDDPRLVAAAQATGADVPVCLAARARMMRGTGEKLGPLLDLPPLAALIVNPGLPLETKHVFARMNLAPGSTSARGPHPDIGSGLDRDGLMARLAKGRNDMEDAACVLAPVIGDVLAVLAAAPGCRLARMSGSGATCFGLFADCRTAGRALKSVRRAQPGWWVKSCVLG